MAGRAWLNLNDTPIPGPETAGEPKERWEYSKILEQTGEPIYSTAGMVFHRNPSFPTQGNIFELKLNTTEPELEVKDLHHRAGLLAPLLKSQQQL